MSAQENIAANIAAPTKHHRDGDRRSYNNSETIAAGTAAPTEITGPGTWICRSGDIHRECHSITSRWGPSLLPNSKTIAPETGAHTEIFATETVAPTTVKTEYHRH